MRQIFLILILTLFFISINCQKNSKDPFIEELDQDMKSYQYVSLIKKSIDTLHNTPNIELERKKEIYLRYAIAVTLRLDGRPRYTVLDTLKKLELDSIYYTKKDSIIKTAYQQFELSRQLLEKNNFAEAKEAAEKACLIFPGLKEAKGLADSIQSEILNQTVN